MTKYILNSGGIKNEPSLKRLFHLEIISGLQTRPKILLVNFAQAREYWEKKFPEYSRAIATDLPNGMEPEFEMAIPEFFVEQIARSDIVYFHGGDDYLLQCWLKQFDIPKIWENKVVATNSASSDALASSFWTADWRTCRDGLGILPIKFIPHFDSDTSHDSRGPIDWQSAYKELEAYGDQSLPIHALREGEYIVIEQ